MASAAKSGHLAWLAAALGAQREKLGKLLCRMTGLGTPNALRPPVFAKFLRMLDQVATAREKEIGLLHEIEEVESRHHARLRDHQLETIHVGSRPVVDEPVPEAEKPEGSWVWLAALWYMFVRDKNKP